MIEFDRCENLLGVEDRRKVGQARGVQSPAVLLITQCIRTAAVNVVGSKVGWKATGEPGVVIEINVKRPRSVGHELCEKEIDVYVVAAKAEGGAVPPELHDSGVVGRSGGALHDDGRRLEIIIGVALDGYISGDLG